MIVLDTSALTKLVVAEPETRALVAHLRGHEVAASALVRAELPRAVLRATPERSDDAEALLDRVLFVELTPEVLDAAGRLPPPLLRTLDAVHVACALELGPEAERFVTYDGRKADAARAHGLVVTAPG